MRIRTLSCRSSAFVLSWALTATAALAAPLPPLALASDLAPGNETAERGYVAPLARLGNVLLVQGTDPLHGTELWRYDLRGGGGERLADLCPGVCNSFPQNAVVLGDHLLFVATDTSHGTELWTTDGTAAGTHLVRDVCPGPCSGLAAGASGTPSALVVAGPLAFFAADDGLAGAEMWRSDGTLAGTVQAADVRPGVNGSQPSQLVSFRGLAYFFAYGGTGGFGFWQSDGTPAGTTRLSAPCAANCQGRLIGASADWLLLETAPCPEGVPGASNLFALDRTGQVHALPVCTRGSTAAFAGDGAFVLGTTPPRLWHVDLAHGTAVDLGQDRFSSAAYGRLAGNLFFFAGFDSQGAEPWVSDGTPAGTRRLADIAAGPGGSFPMIEGVTLGSRLLFSVEMAGGRSLWVSDGTPEGTRALGSPSGAANLRELVGTGTEALFVEATAGERWLWRTNGSPGGTGRVDVLTESHGRSIVFYPLGAWADRAVGFTPHFPQTVPPFTEEVWISDGSADGTRELTADGALASDLSQAVPLAGHLYIAGTSTVLVSDGATASSESVPGDYDSPQQLRAVGSRLYFLAHGPAGSGQPALFAFDPGSPAAVEVAPLVLPRPLTVAGDRLYFVDEDPALGRELLTTRGSVTSRIDVCPGSCSSSPDSLTPLGGRLVFVGLGAGEVRGMTLWSTDGTTAGTVPLRAFPAGALYDFQITPRELVALGNRVYFLAGTAAGDELWSTDGTAAGTVRVLAFSGFGGFSQAGEIVTARHLTAAGSRLFLAVDTPAAGEELWVSDGTPAGTRLVADLRPGPGSSAPQELAAVGERVVFAADDGLSGLELWSSDGTRAGTFLAADVAAGPDPSSPEEVTVTSDRIFFVADDGVHGRELWSLAREAVAAPTCQPNATTLCLQGGRFAVTVTWNSPPNADPPQQGPGYVVPAITTEQTGGFWFFDPTNTELLVKVLDGGVVNRHFWVFYGALSDVPYHVQVRDLATGSTRTYDNPGGTLCGRADVAAFPHASAAASLPPAPAQAEAMPPPDVCHPADPSGLCLGPNGRFFVRVAVIPPGARDPRFATPLTGTANTGFFWFFDPANLELAVKVLDGTAVNGHFWVFFGALTDVRYIVTVFDTQTGAVKNYSNAQGQLCGQADVTAF